MKTKDQDSTLKQEIIEHQVIISELLHYMTAFNCTTCVGAKLPERSSEYLIMLNQMTSQLYNVMGVMRDFFADWPIQCDCMDQLQSPIHETFKMAEYLFDWYPNAFNMEPTEEEGAIPLYQAIYKDAYKYHAIFIDVLNNCLQSHTFLHQYHYPQKKCISCRHKAANVESSGGALQHQE